MKKPDPRDLPSYAIAEAARYLGLSAATVRRWCAGRPPHPPLFALPPRAGESPVLLSFFNLAELHVLAAVRRQHGMSMPKVGCALDFLRHRLPPADRRHPLLSPAFAAGGLEPFAERYGELAGLGREERASLRVALRAALQRVERDARGLPAKLYPFAGGGTGEEAARISVEPGLSAGRPVIDGTGLVVEIIAGRHRAGESIGELARDYGRPAEEIAAAVGCG